jgi:hypothetical protein
MTSPTETGGGLQAQRRFLCVLVPINRAEDDRFVSKLWRGDKPPICVEHCGRTYFYTGKNAIGGAMAIYHERRLDPVQAP